MSGIRKYRTQLCFKSCWVTPFDLKQAPIRGLNSLWRAVARDKDYKQNGERKLNYIYQKLVEEEIVYNAEDYKYSSAINYIKRYRDLKVKLL